MILSIWTRDDEKQSAQVKWSATAPSWPSPSRAVSRTPSTVGEPRGDPVGDEFAVRRREVPAGIEGAQHRQSVRHLVQARPIEALLLVAQPFRNVKAAG